MYRIESFLSARLFLRPQTVGKRIYFISNLSGKLSLYAMDYGGSIPEPLLPPDIALQNPHLLDGESFHVFPGLAKIVVLIDQNGDENYQPQVIPQEGGFPEPAFNNFFADYRVHLARCDHDQNRLYFVAESRKENKSEAYLGLLDTSELVKLGESAYGCVPGGVNQSHSKVILIDKYLEGDTVLYQWTKDRGSRELLHGTPLESRPAGYAPIRSNFFAAHYVLNDRAILLGTTLFDDRHGLGLIDLDHPEEVSPVSITGIQHTGSGELVDVLHLAGHRYLLTYNIDGSSWVYEGIFNGARPEMELTRNLTGSGLLSNGVVEAISYESGEDRFTLAFSQANSPTQIYTIEGSSRQNIRRHTNEQILGILVEQLSAGEDASFTSYDGTHVSARLYLPSASLSYAGPRPVVYYIHGGPQSQERPDFAWFSMPLIQFLTLNGFAVFVSNVRGSTGYGLSYTAQVDRDWGGKDLQDHVHAMTAVLTKDSRLDINRAGVVGRSYGGYMTLMLAGLHPELWSAAVDMFGPYDLVTFLQRIPPTWIPYYRLELGDPDLPEDRAFLDERSPHTHIHHLACPMLVIQGANDPRVVERESRDLVENLRSQGKTVEYLMFDNEGHDVLKYENRVTCYSAITEFFKKALIP